MLFFPLDRLSHQPNFGKLEAISSALITGSPVKTPPSKPLQPSNMTSNPVHADSARIVPTDIRAAQNSFVCPPGYRMFRIPPMSGARSHMYDYGVRVEEVTDDHPDEHHKSSTTNSMLPETPGTSEFPWGKKRRVPGRFYCLADARCRDRRTVVKISNKCTSSASDHLRIIHGITSDKGSPRGRSS